MSIGSFARPNSNMPSANYYGGTRVFGSAHAARYDSGITRDVLGGGNTPLISDRSGK